MDSQAIAVSETCLNSGERGEGPVNSTNSLNISPFQQQEPATHVVPASSKVLDSQEQEELPIESNHQNLIFNHDLGEDLSFEERAQSSPDIEARCIFKRFDLKPPASMAHLSEQRQLENHSDSGNSSSPSEEGIINKVEKEAEEPSVEIQELKVMRKWVVLWTALCVSSDLTSSESALFNVVFRWSFYIHTLYLVVACVLAYKFSPKHAKGAIISLNFRMVCFMLLNRDNATEVLEQHSEVAMLYGLAIVMARLYFTLVGLVVNSIMCLAILQDIKPIVRKGFLLATVIGSMIVNMIVLDGANLVTYIPIFSQFMWLTVILLITGFVAASVNKQYFRLHTRNLATTQHRNEQFQRIIDQMQQAVLVIKNGAPFFENSMAQAMLDGPAVLAFSKKTFFVLKEAEDEKSAPVEVRRKKKASEALSLKQILELEKDELESKIFISNSELVNSHQKLQSELERATSPTFLCFKARVFSLEKLEEGGDEEFCLQLTDVSHQVLIEAMKRERKEEAASMKKKCGELKNPLNSLNAEIEALSKALLQGGEASASQAEAPAEERYSASLELCQTSCQLLRFNLENLLVRNLNENQIIRRIQRSSIPDAVRKVMKIHELQTKNTKIEFTSHFEGFLAPRGEEPRIDKTRLQQVLFTFQSNALRFMDKEEGKVSVVAQLVTTANRKDTIKFLKARVEDFYSFNLMEDNDQPYSLFSSLSLAERVVLTVMDNGMGIKESEKLSLFEPKGALCGDLAIVKKIASQMGGEPKVFSSVGAGSILQVSFSLEHKCSIVPCINQYHKGLKKQQLKCMEHLRSISENPDGFQYSSRRLLIVDDEHRNCQALVSLISMFEVPDVDKVIDVVYTGERAITKLAQNIRRISTNPLLSINNVCDYEVIFVDCSLPLMDGLECSQRLKQILQQGKIVDRPLIVGVATDITLDLIEKAMSKGMDQIITKPVQPEDIAKILLERKFRITVPEPLQRVLGSPS